MHSWDPSFEHFLGRSRPYLVHGQLHAHVEHGTPNLDFKLDPSTCESSPAEKIEIKMWVLFQLG